MISKTKSILFIFEQGVIDGKYYFGSSGDLLFISQAIRDGLEVYLTTPKQVLEQHQSADFLVLKLSNNLSQNQIDEQIKLAWYDQTINALLALEMDANENERAKSKILFANAAMVRINIYQIPIFNRAEPASLTDKFYDILINWHKNGAKILPNPHLNKILGDKQAIEAIHYGRTIANIDLLAGLDLANDENQISFKSKIITISNNNLSGEEIAKFYDLLIAKNFPQAKSCFEEEYQIFIQGVGEYLVFHQELGDNSVLKPLNYFSGIGIVVIKNQKLDLELAVQNIAQSFLAIKQNCQESQEIGDGNLAFLPQIIVQERATEAHFGDLRIVFCGNNLQGIFVRINRNFFQSNINNLRFGGHPKSLFNHYPISKKGIDQMIVDMKNDGALDEEIKRAKALYGLLKTINFLGRIKIFEQYPIIGIDALLTQDEDKNYRYGINEINLTSPMGQAQLIILEIAIKFSNFALGTLARNLARNNFSSQIKLAKYQILADYFIKEDVEIALRAKEILLQDEQLKNLIMQEISGFLIGENIAKQTLQHLDTSKNWKAQLKEPPNN